MEKFQVNKFTVISALLLWLNFNSILGVGEERTSLNNV